MKMFSYHTKMRLRKVLQVLGILALAALAVWVCWMVWLQRYVVFTRDGVIFDFGRSSLDLGEKETRPGEPEQTLDVQVEFREAPPEAQSLSRLSGVYVDTDRLQAGVETASQALGSLEPGTAVMLDVKSKFGNFYYTTGLSGASQSDTIEAAAMDALLADLIRQDCYLIARLPAFRDSAFAEANPDSGLALDSGALWTDEEQCYWLDPASQTVMANLILLALIWLFLEILDDKTEGAKTGFWILMALTNVAAAMMTSMGAFLAGLFLGIVSLVAALRKKKPSLLGRTVLCCIPNAVFLVMLLVMG